MDKKQLYGNEISLLASEEHQEYVRLNLEKIRARRQRFGVPVVALAGAEGKTSTKRMLYAILSRCGTVLETPLDCDNAIDICNTLLQLKESHDFVLLELGMINARQFELAVRVAQPTIGLITNVGETHSPQVGDKFEVAKTQLELIRRLPPSGSAVLNMDDELVNDMASFAPTPNIIKFGLNRSAQFYASDIEYLGPAGTRFLLNGEFPLHLPVYCSASVYNALAAIAVARALGVDLSTIAAALQNDYAILEGRGNLLVHQGMYIFNYTYDATVNSVPRACEALVQLRQHCKQLTLVLGEMRDAQGDGRVAHLNLGFYLSALPIDTVITVGPKAAYVAEGIRRINHTRKKMVSFPNLSALQERIVEFLKPESALLITGSKEQNLAPLIPLICQQTVRL
ncbi:MAG: hypothetical protein D6715_06335 [Calditrichaeota bacterium]|nr:MAG: hypothetical protein D6715_06335 [Calditrichota bacterium]